MTINSLFDLCNSNNIELLIRSNLKTDLRRKSDKLYYCHIFIEKYDNDRFLYEIFDIFNEYYDEYNDMIDEAYNKVKLFLLKGSIDNGN